LFDIRGKNPKFIFVALPIPFQEKWIFNHLRFFTSTCAVGVGGSFDVLSGNLKRSPSWVKKIGFEWLFRTIQEPWRWKRAATLPLFIIKALLSPSTITVNQEKQPA